MTGQALTTEPQGHVHTRSHSFTPKLPSKLAPRYPPSPQRAYSHDNQPQHDNTTNTNINMREGVSNANYPHGPYPPQGTPTRAAFGFGFGGLSRSQDSAPSPTTQRSTTLLPPPTIVEPKRPEDPQSSSSSDPNQKRSSQILLHSGFLNRLADLPANFPHPSSHSQLNLSSSKGWKPFKVELKGSKLFFYKPPSSDRSNAIKDLFPTGLVAPQDEEEDEEMLDPPASAVSGVSASSKFGPGREEGGSGTTAGGTSRKKRAYWGRKTHPDLVVDTHGEVERGSFEALTHEAVFATTFSLDEDQATAEVTEDEPRADTAEPTIAGSLSPQAASASGAIAAKKQKYHIFAASILCSLPLIIPRAQFESEFLRCCSFLVSGEPLDTRQALLKARVGWLANEYVRYHGHPLDGEAWSDFKKETLDGEQLSAEMAVNDAGSGGPQASASTQGIFHPSPVPGDDTHAQGTVESVPSTSMSPNLNTFSPRPEDGGSKMVSLLDALFPPVHLDLRSQDNQRQGPQTSRLNLNLNTRYPWVALQEEGMTREVLFSLDPYIVAKSLTLFHRSVMEMCPENIVVELLVPAEGQDKDDRDGDSEETEPGASFKSAEAIFGTDDRPHWLTKLVLLQILAGDAGPLAPPPPAATSLGGSGATYPLPTPPLSTQSLNTSLNLASPGRRSEDRLLSSSTPSSASTPPQHNQPVNANLQQTSRTHSRSELISTWARIGELCRTSGDELSWRAIMAALCSRPIARLDKAWKRVDPQALAAVEGWANLTATSSSDELSIVPGSVASMQAQAPVTIWGGDVRLRLSELLNKASGSSSGSAGDGSTVVEVEHIVRARKVFETFRTSFLLCPRRAMVSDKEVSEDARRLVGHWRNVAAEGGVTSGLAVKFQRFVLRLSL